MLTQKLTLNTPPRVDSKAELLEAKDVGIGRYYPLHFKSWWSNYGLRKYSGCTLIVLSKVVRFPLFVASTCCSILSKSIKFCLFFVMKFIVWQISSVVSKKYRPSLSGLASFQQLVNQCESVQDKAIWLGVHSTTWFENDRFSGHCME